MGWATLWDGRGCFGSPLQKLAGCCSLVSLYLPRRFDSFERLRPQHIPPLPLPRIWVRNPGVSGCSGCGPGLRAKCLPTPRCGPRLGLFEREQTGLTYPTNAELAMSRSANSRLPARLLLVCSYKPQRWRRSRGKGGALEPPAVFRPRQTTRHPQVTSNPRICQPLSHRHRPDQHTETSPLKVGRQPPVNCHETQRRCRPLGWYAARVRGTLPPFETLSSSHG